MRTQGQGADAGQVTGRGGGAKSERGVRFPWNAACAALGAAAPPPFPGPPIRAASPKGA